MRRLLSFLIIAIFQVPLFASWQLGTDLRCIDSFFLESVRVDAEVSYKWDNIRLTIPARISHSLDYEMGFAEIGVLVSVYPFDGKGLFIGASMTRLGFFWGIEAPDEKLMLFSEIVAGWTFSLPWFFVEPRLSITDAFSSEEGRLGMLRRAIPQYSTFRLSLVIGIEIQ